MPRISVPRVGMSDRITIGADGSFCFPKRVMDRLGWKPPLRISVDYFHDHKIDDAPLVLFLNVDTSPEGQGYAVSFLNRSGQSGTGGKTNCTQLTRNVLSPRIALPKYDIEPIYPVNQVADLLLVLTEPSWEAVEFTMAGCQSIYSEAAPVIGAYEMLGGDGVPLRIGEGNIRDRIREHLKDERLVRTVKRVRYFPVSEKKDAELMEQVLLARYETRYETLPTHNMIRA